MTPTHISSKTKATNKNNGSLKQVLRTYYYLAKPGIVYGNLLSAVGGFLLAADGRFLPWRFVAMAAGLAFVMGGGCVANNIIDRPLDRKMARTKKRALVTGAVTVRKAAVYSTGLLTAGLLLLYAGTNTVTAAVALFGFFAYVVLYGVGKRTTIHGTLIGSISGAIPPVVGYTAVSGRLDAAAWLLFGALVCWQMPHFYAIALYRHGDYAAAGLPVLPVKMGSLVTKITMLVYIALFGIAVCALAAYSVVGKSFLFVMTTLTLIWLGFGVKGFAPPHEDAWARLMFKISLLVLLVLCVMLSLEAWLP